MVRKDNIIKYWLKDKSKPIKDIARELNINISQVSQAVSSYYNSLNIGKDIGFCFSLFYGRKLGYLFDDYSEREVLIEDNEILNKNDFTEYELMWLFQNYKLGEYNKTEKFSYLNEAVKELEEQLQNTIIFTKKKKIKEKIKILTE